MASPVGRSPESASQGEAWERVKLNALTFGLCHRCAAQLAWAHQEGTGGFAAVHPPCEACKPLVAVLPRPVANQWRTVNGSASKPAVWPSPPACDRSDPIPAQRELRRPARVDEQLRDREA